MPFEPAKPHVPDYSMKYCIIYTVRGIYNPYNFGAGNSLFALMMVTSAVLLKRKSRLPSWCIRLSLASLIAPHSLTS